MASESQANLGDPQVQHPPGAAPEPPSISPQQMRMLTDEEKAVMNECERQSFFLSSLPFSTGAMIAASTLVQGGIWKGHPRYGGWPKMIIAGSIGFFVGKIMYVPICKKKILEKIPHSNLANTIRKAEGIPQRKSHVAPWEPGSDEEPREKSKLTDDYTALEGLDDRNRPSVDREMEVDNDDKEEKKPMTYDELRRRNRQEYEDNRGKQPAKAPGSYRNSPLMPQQPWPDRPKSAPPSQPEFDDGSAPSSQAPPKRKRTNIWGDPIEE